MDVKEAIEIVKGIKRNGWWIFDKGVKTEFCEVAISIKQIADANGIPEKITKEG